MEGGRGDHEVVPDGHDALPGIIGAVDIAFRHGLGRECLDEMAHRFPAIGSSHGPACR